MGWTPTHNALGPLSALFPECTPYNMEKRITDNIQELKRVLPERIQAALDGLGNTENLLEIVLDLGREPAARFTDREVVLTEGEITHEELEDVVQEIGQFDADNRAGMERTLHRISAIRNRKGQVVGLTCRVGRAVYGTIDIIHDLIVTGKSILMLGPPGVGKTTMLREAARVLAETKRVVIVDTSNEIGGDGDVPHPAVGRARRMQVSRPERQHEVMIEAVENHNPEVIVIDEIGRELEAMAARTIAERGVQLIGTAHGNALDNLMLNPTLSDLVGGIESVTLSDDEARRRGTQKTVLERRAPPTFEVLVEIKARDELVVHEDVATAVDTVLRGRAPQIQVRRRQADGSLDIEVKQMPMEERNQAQGFGRSNGAVRNERDAEPAAPRERRDRTRSQDRSASLPPMTEPTAAPARSTNGNGNGVKAEGKSIKIHAYGVARNRLLQAAKRLHVSLDVTDDVNRADAVMTLKTLYRRRPKLIVDAERRGMPIYVLRANTVSQIEDTLIDMFGLEVSAADPFGAALQEAETAISRVREGAPFVDLSPQGSVVRRHQHQLARRADLESRSFGEEPNRYVRIIRE